MNFCPGGAECDDDEFDDGFLFDCDDTNDEKSHLRTHEYSVIYVTALITKAFR